MVVNVIQIRLKRFNYKKYIEIFIILQLQLLLLKLKNSFAVSNNEMIIGTYIHCNLLRKVNIASLMVVNFASRK